MKFREILLVAVLILAGFVFFQFKTGKWDVNWDWDWDGGFGRFAGEASAEETRTFEAPLPAAIEVRNGHGWVEVRGADQDTVQLTFKKTAWRRTDEEAREVVERLGYAATAEADKLVLTTNRDEFARKNFETGFVLTVPKGMAVRVDNAYGVVRIDGVSEATVRNRHGEVFVADVGGPCDLETSYEDVEVQRVVGTCRVVNRNAEVRAGAVQGDLWIETSYDRVRVEDAGGRVEVRGSNVDVDARRVAGAVAVETSYEKVYLADVGPAKVTARNAAVTAMDVRGDLDVRTSYDPVQASRVQGSFTVTADNASVTADGIGGATIDVTTSYEKVALAGFSAAVRVSNRSGLVSLEPSDLRHGMDVRNENGEITLAWPNGERARFEAQAKGGTVHWSLGERPDVEQSNGVSLVKAFQAEAGAPLVFLSTTYDDIRIVPAARKF
jgi:DUF4097 and DUF4098 domain-containing protein YvlB